MSEIVKLKDLCFTEITDGTHKTPIYSETGYIFLSSKNVTSGEIDWDNVAYIPEELHNELYHRLSPRKDDILLAKNGTTGVAAIVDKEEVFDIYVSLALIRPNTDIVVPKYLLYAINSPSSKKYFDSNLKGIGVPNLHLTHIKDTPIRMCSISEQEKIAATLDKVTALISLRKKQLEKLDELVKSRFIELFGDPVTNPFNFEKVPLSFLADIKIGPFGSLLHKDDYINNGYPLVNPSHIIDGKIVPDNELTLSQEKYDQMIAYHLHKGDVVMGRRGEMGRCAVVQSEGLICGTGSLIIRSKGEITADYIQKVISFPSFKKTIEDMAVGQTMPNLNVPIVSSFQIIKPPIYIQNAYYAFVAQTDKSKLAVQKSLEQLETLKKSLMQKYFG